MAMDASDRLQEEFIIHSQKNIGGRMTQVAETFRRPKDIVWGCKPIEICCDGTCCDPNQNIDVQKETLTTTVSNEDITAQEEIQTTITSSQSTDIQKERQTTVTTSPNADVQEEMKAMINSSLTMEYQMVKQIDTNTNQTTDFPSDILSFIRSRWIYLGYVN